MSRCSSGPWVVGSLPPAGRRYICDGGGEIVAAVAEWRDDGTLLHEFPNAEANAHLIASVPDLLACLERLRGECAGLLFAHRAAIAEDGGTWTIEILEQCMAAAAAAIAKSEGQTSLIPEVTR